MKTITEIDIQLMARQLAELNHGGKKPFTWTEVRSHWSWLVQHAEHIKPPKYGASPAVYKKEYTSRVLELTREYRDRITYNK